MARTPTRRLRHATRFAALALLAAGALAAGVAAEAEEPGSVTFIDGAEGTFLVGLVLVAVGGGEAIAEPAPATPPVNLARWERIAPACHRVLWADLDFTPQNATVATAELPFRFALRWSQNGTTTERIVEAPTTSLLLGLLPEEGAFTFDLELRIGTQVDWNVTLRATRTMQGAACEPPPLPEPDEGSERDVLGRH